MVMKRKFTDEDILRFIYEEMKPKESDDFLTALCSDETLWERYEHFQTVNEDVQKAVLEPSVESCERVMAYVRETAPLQKKPVQKPESSIRTFLAGKIPVAISLNAVVVVGFIMFISVAILGFTYELTRGAIITPSGPLVQQTEIELNPSYDWDDSEIDEKLKNIREGVETIQDDPVL